MRRGVAEAERVHAEAIILHMHTPGGTVGAAKDIVNLMVHTTIPTYTYVDTEAFSAGAIIALSTDHIYMAPGSVIGDAMPILMSPFSGPQELPDDIQEKQVSAVAALIRSAAEQGGHDKELAEAMVRREKEYKIGDEIISREGELLTLTNVEAERPLREDGAPLLSLGTLPDIDALLERIGLGDAQVVTLEATGSERIARVIKLLAPLFLGAGLLGLWIEFKTPGIGIPGLVGALSLVIFFWGHHIAGLAGAEEVLIVLVGVGFLAAEIFFFPGFGFAGLTGLFLIFWGLLMAMVQHYPGGPILPSWDALTAPVGTLTGGMLIAVGTGRRPHPLPPRGAPLPRPPPRSGHPRRRRLHRQPRGLPGPARRPGPNHHRPAPVRDGHVRRPPRRCRHPWRFYRSPAAGPCGRNTWKPDRGGGGVTASPPPAAAKEAQP
jgi:membrane-bound serine protease (ClpP class)